MKGILIVSHGGMAAGVYDSMKLFYGEELPQVDYLSLTLDTGPEIFKDQLEEKIKELNTGEGVLVFSDLFGGTPANVSSMFANDEIDVITGMNLSMILEYMGLREADLDVKNLVSAGQKSIIWINEMLSQKK